MSFTKEIIDLHIHTVFSYDGKSRAEEYVLSAIAAGDKRIGFSEHYDYDCELSGTGKNAPLCNLAAYKNEIERLKDEYSDKIEILFGIEFGYDKRACARYSELTEKFGFDYVINSVHLFKGTDFYLSDEIKKYGVSAKELFGRYFETVAESVCADYPFQIVGHLGYPLRYSPSKEENFGYEEFAFLYDEIFKRIIAKNKFLEINTSTKTDRSFFPCEKTVERYVSFGGKNFTFGSDAHRVMRYKDGEAAAKTFAEKFGIKFSFFKKGKAY